MMIAVEHLPITTSLVKTALALLNIDECKNVLWLVLFASAIYMTELNMIALWCASNNLGNQQTK